MPNESSEHSPTQQDSTRAWEANARYWDDYLGEGNRWHLELVWPLTTLLLGDVEGARILRLPRRVCDVGGGDHGPA
jgi:hypothetical protein